MNDFNPYAVPKSAAVTEYTDAEQERRLHINHEASVKLLGGLGVLSGFLMVVLTLYACVDSSSRSANSSPLGIIGFIGCLAILNGLGLWKFNPFARAITIFFSMLGFLMSCLSLPAGSVGCIMDVYVLWLLLSKKGRRIFKPDYKDIILAAPNVKARNSTVTRVVLGILILLVVRAVIGAFVNRSSW